MCHEHSGTECADGIAGAKRGHEGSGGETTISFSQMQGDDFGAAGESDGFADAEDQAHSEQRGKGASCSGGGRCQGPDEKSNDQNARRVEAIHHPADDELHAGGGGEKGGEGNAELRGCELKFVFKQGSSDGKIAAVDIVDEDADAEEDEGRGEEQQLVAGGLWMRVVHAVWATS